jgi:hypothetical protein
VRRVGIVLLVAACEEPRVDDDVLLVEFDGQAPNGLWERVEPRGRSRD